jgi:hypothetical protein
MAKKSNKESLAKEALRASRIQQTLVSNGWKDIMDIIHAKYDDSMNSLIEKENPEARGAIQAITEIMNDISTDLQFGENARRKYNEQYLNIKRPAGE